MIIFIYQIKDKFNMILLIFRIEIDQINIIFNAV